MTSKFCKTFNHNAFMSFFHNLWQTWLCSCSREGGELFLLHFINVGDIARVKSGDPLSFNQQIVV